MSLLALNASLGGAPPPAEHPRDLGGKSAGGSNFTAMVRALDGEDPPTNAFAAGTPIAASPQDQASPIENTPKSYEPRSIDAGLAGLVYGALASPVAATPSQFVSRNAGARSAAQQDASGSTSAAANASPTPGEALRRALAGRSAAVNSDTATGDSAAAAPAPAAEKGADADLTIAGLLYGALASPVAATPGQFVPRAAGGVSWRALDVGGSVASSDQASDGLAAAALAPAVEKGAGANFALAGVLDGPLTIRTAANGDSSLGVSAIRSRTYLGIDSAARSGASNAIWRSQARSAATATAPARSATAGALAAAEAAVAPAPSETPSEKRSASGAAATATAPARSATAGALAAAEAAVAPPPSKTPSEKQSASGAVAAGSDTAGALAAAEAAATSAPSATPPEKRSASAATATATVTARSDTAATVAAAEAAVPPTPSATPPEKRSTSNHNESQTASLAEQSGGRGQAAVDASASFGGVNLGVNPVMSGAGPIACDQLAERLATQASELTTKAAPSDSTAATGVGTAQAVKELQIDLDPADLGAVSVKMRLAGGKLSVVMEVATPSTLTAIENERDAIAGRLGSTAQPLESLIIKPAATSQTNAESDNARNHKPGSQENAQSDSNGESRGNGRQPSRRESATDQGDPRAAARQPISRRGFGDLIV